MAVWTIKRGGSGSGRHLEGCRIVVTHSGGLITYQFLPPLGLGSGPLGSSTISPPNIKGISYQEKKWDISSITTPPLNPLPKTKWDGSCFDTTEIEDDPGTWQAESGGGGPRKPPRPSKKSSAKSKGSAKSKSSAKSSRKSSSKKSSRKSSTKKSSRKSSSKKRSAKSSRKRSS